MSNLNSPSPLDEKTIPWFPTALRYGLMAAGLSIIYSLIAYMFEFAIPTTIGQMALQFIIMIGITVTILVLALRHHRNNELDGHMSFGRAFLVGWVTLVISGIISSLFQMLYIHVIDPEFVNIAVDKMEILFEKFGLPEDQMETQLADVKERFSMAGLLKQGFLIGPIFAAFMAAIFGAIFKKKRPFE